MSSIIYRLVNQSRFHHLGNNLNPQIHGWTRCSFRKQYHHLQRQQQPHLGNQLKCPCFSNVGKEGGRFKSSFLNRIERFLDRLRARWLYFRYEGSLGPPESVSVKNTRKLKIQGISLGLILILILIVANNFNIHYNYPVYLNVKIWPDNIEEYRDILDAKSGKSSPKSASSTGQQQQQKQQLQQQ